MTPTATPPGWSQQRLLDLGFWLAGVDGEYGTTTRQAVMAFQKYHLVEATGEVDPATAELLTAMPIRAVATARTGDLVEINKVTQLLFVVRGGVTMWVFNASTGNGLPYEEEDQNTPGKIVKDVGPDPRRRLEGQPRAGRGLVGGRPGQDLPPQVLQGRRGRARLGQRAQLPRLPRLRARERGRHGLHLGTRPDADAIEGLGPQLTPPPGP